MWAASHWPCEKGTIRSCPPCHTATGQRMASRSNPQLRVRARSSSRQPAIPFDTDLRKASASVAANSPVKARLSTSDTRPPSAAATSLPRTATRSFAILSNTAVSTGSPGGRPKTPRYSPHPSPPASRGRRQDKVRRQPVKWRRHSDQGAARRRPEREGRHRTIPWSQMCWHRAHRGRPPHQLRHPRPSARVVASSRHNRVGNT